jgi:hypothetical protein
MGVSNSKANNNTIFMSGLNVEVESNLLNDSKINSELFNKFYHIPSEINNSLEINIINVKKLDNKIYLYIYDVYTNKATLVHIFEPSVDIDNIEKYIQISHNFQLLSIPDSNFLHIFKVDDIIKNKLLKSTELNIKIKIKKDIEITNLKMGTQYKSILYPKRYVTIYKNECTYESVEVNDFISKTFLSFQINKTDCDLVLSENGKYLLLNDKKNQSSIDIINLSDMSVQKININSKLFDKMIITDDGELVILFLNESKKIKLVHDNKTNEYDLGISSDILFETSVNIFDYSNLVQTCDKIYVLTIWNKSKLEIFVYSLICFKGTFLLQGPKCVKFNQIHTQKYSIYSNGKQYIYSFKKNIIVYNINKIIPFIVLDNVLDTLLYTILCRKTEPNIKTKLTVECLDNKESFLIKKWLFDLFLLNDECKENTIILNSYENFNIFTTNTGQKQSSVAICLTLIQDHYNTDDYINYMLGEHFQKGRFELVLNLIFKITNILKNTKDKNDVVNYYLEYIIIKFVFVLYKNKYGNGQTDIRLIIKTFNKLQLTKNFVLKSTKLIFGVDISELV